MAVEIATAYVSLVPSARGIHAAIARELGQPLNAAAGKAGDDTSRSFASRFTTGIASAAGAIARAGTLAFAAFGTGAIAAGAFGLRAAADFEQTRIAFEGILGSATKADTFLQKLRDFAAKTPFEFPELARASKQLLAVGFSADEVLPIMTRLGNVAATLGVGGPAIEGVVRALGQMRGKGKASAEELQQISEQIPGFSAIQAIAEDLGVTTAEAFEQMAQGAIPADRAITAILAGMEKFPGAAGAMERQSKTLNGVLSTFKDTVRDALINTLEPFLPAISSALAGAAPKIGQALQSAGQGIGDFIAGPISGLADTLKANLPEIKAAALDAFAVLADVFKRVADFIRDPLLPALLQVGAAIKDAAPAVISLARDGFAALLAAAKPLVPIVAAIASGLIRFGGALARNRGVVIALAAAVGSLVAVTKAHAAVLKIHAAGGLLAWIKNLKLAQTVTKVWTAVQWAANAALTAFPVIAIVAGIAALVAGLIYAYQNVEPFRNAVDAVGRALKDVFDFVVRNWKTIGAVLLTAVAPFIGVPLLIIQNWDTIVTFFKEIPGRILGFLADLPGLLVDLGQKLIGGLFEGVKLHFEILKVFWTGLPGVILGLLGDVGRWLLDVGGKVIQGFFNGVVLYFELLKTFWIELPARIVLFVLQNIGKLVDLGREIISRIKSGILIVAAEVYDFFRELPGKIAGFVTDKVQDLIDIGKKIVEKIVDGIKSAPNIIKDALSDLIPSPGDLIGGGGWIPDIPGFASGGVVPGPIGRPQLIVAHGGETILPTHQGDWSMAGGGALVGQMTVVATSTEDVFQPLRRLQRLAAR